MNQKLENLLEKNRQKAKLEREIYDYKLEQQYFEHYFFQRNIPVLSADSFHRKKKNTSKFPEEQILDFILNCQLAHKRTFLYKFFYILKLYYKYKMKNPIKFHKHYMEYILNLERLYYQYKIKNLEEQYHKLVAELEQASFDDLQDEHQHISEKIFQKKLYEKYSNRPNNFTFENYTNDMVKFTDSFPVILSTTYSLRNSIPKHYMFDYVIIDESSQVDLLAGSLALSCAKNAVIVGDKKQLPQIIDRTIKQKVKNFSVDSCHDYFENSILSAFQRTYKEKIPSQLLTEHYRCHPMIINFCNKRYYKDQLIAYANEKHLQIEKPLILYYTAPGNHMRKITNGKDKGTYNQRELDVIKEEVLKHPSVLTYQEKDIGITAPYRLQADRMSNYLEENQQIESDTIHKYQGREKKLMILSTVLDSTSQGKKSLFFVDDPCMINVAVSRAMNQFVLVTDHKLFFHEGHEVNALLKYIQYNTLHSELIESQLVSVFDLLYQEYSDKLRALNGRLQNRSKYKSERIVDTILEELFQNKEYQDFLYERQVILYNLIKNTDHLNPKEIKYLHNKASLDFIICDKMNHQPLLAIEVDGFAFHENNPIQQKRDQLKNQICAKSNLPLLRLRTNDWHDETRLKQLIHHHLFH